MIFMALDLTKSFHESRRVQIHLSLATTPEQLREGVRRLAPYWKA